MPAAKISELIALPPRAPVWLMPSHSPRACAKVFELYQPARLIPKLIVFLVRRTLDAGIGQPALRRFGSSPSTSTLAAVSGAVAALAECSGIEPHSVGAWTGAPGPWRKLTCVCLDEYGVPVAYIKIGMNGNTARALDHEAEVLDRLVTTELADRVPRILFRSVTPQRTMIGVTPLLGTKVANAVTFGERHLDFLAELATVPVEMTGQEHIESLRTRVLHLTKTSDNVRVIGEALDLAEPLLNDDNFLTMSHGDFTPWNCLQYEDRLVVVDWERAGPRSALFDYSHYEAQQLTFVKRRSVDKSAKNLVRSSLLPGKILERILGRGISAAAVCRLRALALAEGLLHLAEWPSRQDERSTAIRLKALNMLLAEAGNETAEAA